MGKSARVLVVEDEDVIRNNIARILRAEGFEVFAAADGRSGLHLAQSLLPDVILSDINMPVMDGFALLEALRAETSTRPLPFIFLTAQDDRGTFRRGMSMGADDFIPKPFVRDELLDAINSRIKRVEETAATDRRSLNHQYFTDLYGGKDAQLPVELQPTEQPTRTGAILVAELTNALELARRMSAAETSHLLHEFFRRALLGMAGQGVQHLCFSAAGLVGTYIEPEGARPESVVGACRRGMVAAADLIGVDAALAEWVNERFRARELPPPKVSVVLHAGMVAPPAALATLSTAPASDSMESALALAAQTRGLPMRVKVSDAAVARAGTGFDCGDPSPPMTTPAGKAVRVRELQQASAWARRAASEGAGEQRSGSSAALAGLPAVKSCLEENVKSATRALQEVLSAFTPPPEATQGMPIGAPEFKGYRILKSVGQGGMSRVYLAEREHDNILLALKVLDLQASGGASALSTNQIDRFVQEYTLVSRVAHPNVVRIFDQGFTDNHAYIAMEYFEGGDVKQLIRRLAGSTPDGERRKQTLAVVRQAARALVAVHAQAITHRDMKPENLMFRADGSLALADFGIAKHAQQATLTQHGYIVGTPLYLSPEQAGGRPATAQSDLYSLGVILYELLTGQLPFVGDNVQSILAQHMIAPPPKLPPAFADLQPVLEWLLAKEPQQRCPNAAALADVLDSL
jgi:DNA-binding response OmpR family regulator